MKKLRKFVLFLIVLFVLVTLWYLDFTDPVITWDTPADLGGESQISLKVQDEGKGLRRIELSVRQMDAVHDLHSRAYAVTKLPWEQGPVAETVVLSTESWRSKLELEDGPVEITAKVEDQSNLWLFSRRVEETRTFNFDTRPPRADVLSDQHYISQGGSEAVLYRVTESNCTSGVQVGENSFQGYPATSHKPGTYIALFALAHDQKTDTPIFLWAEDAAGNRSETRFWYKPKEARFRKRRIEITDRFIRLVAPEILSHSPSVKEQDTSLATFLQINSVLRGKNNRLISEISTTSHPEPLWTEPFLQLSNSKVESNFADYRTYYYQGEAIDEQVHLGFDLASLAKSAVEASNRGNVVYADYLGIYGNCVILDHGLGLFSLYGHLSSVDVKKGESVERGQSLGRTGQTGLAGGDHLHYSMIVQGVQVTPLEWWDPKWVQVHLLNKLEPTEGTTEN